MPDTPPPPAPTALSPADLDRLRALCEQTPGPLCVCDEAAVAIHRSMFGIEHCPDGVTILHRPPQSRREAMETFFEAVIVGWMAPPMAEWIAAARTALPLLLDLVTLQRAHLRKDSDAIEELAGLCEAKDQEIARLRAALAAETYGNRGKASEEPRAQET